ncbi:hypothetical protein [Lysobacter gummosus]|uniref:hypothetical protein n=1 Tax=Lysobacter gummosus TaxID=262324 RepID=UPI00362E652C
MRTGLYPVLSPLRLRVALISLIVRVRRATALRALSDNEAIGKDAAMPACADSGAAIFVAAQRGHGTGRRISTKS